MSGRGGDVGCAVMMILIVVIANCIFFPPLILVVLGLVLLVSLEGLFDKFKNNKSADDSLISSERKPATACVEKPSSQSSVSTNGLWLTDDVATRFNIRGMLKTCGVGVKDLVQGGETLLLQRDPGNAYDSNAILAVAASGVKIGYVAREVAARLSPKMDAGEKFVVRVVPGSYSEWRHGECLVELLSDEEPWCF